MGSAVYAAQAKESLATVHECNTELRNIRNVRSKLHSDTARITRMISTLDEGNPIKAQFDRQVAMLDELEKKLDKREEEINEKLEAAQATLKSARQKRNEAIREEYQSVG